VAAASDELRLRRAVEIIQDLERRLAEHDASDAEPIAVVGLACRMPGCDSAEELWQLLDEGRDPIAGPSIAGRMPSGRIASLESFDAGFFEISAREAVTMDPRQRITLETTWEALEHAGVVPGALEGARVGVFVGASGFVSPLGTEGNLYEFTGALPGVIAGRVSYALGLRGPCMSIDTACSSSLVALHLACKALRARECTMALAGGVGRVEPALLDVESAEALAHLARRGRCRTFDAAADGIVLSDGCGMVVLKRLGDAERDGDRILAVVRGSALGHDGRAQGLTVPSMVAQEDVVQRALADARVDPDEIAYVECHGTGTPLGDPIEVQALSNVFGRGRARPLVLGSIKSNIGHTDAAAGVAGVVKVILALQHGRIPANLHFATPNPHIPWGELAVTVAAEPVSWPRSSATRLAGVSSFGISGTNAHLVLQEAPAPVGAVRPVAPRSAQLVVLSGKTAEALDQAAARLRSHLEAHPELALDDVAYSLAVTRTHHEHRLACPVASTAELGQALARAARGAHGELPVGASRGQASPGSKVVFVCSGQGSQWIGMGQQLLDDEPVFRDALAACDRAILRETGWSVLDQLRAPARRSQLHQVDVVQPALFAIAVALAALWRSWGIEPSAVVGHSQGEIAAACIAGALTLEAAAAVVCRRSRLVRRICGRGEMAMVQLPLAETQAALRGREHALSVAVTSSRRSTVISGAPEAMAEVLAALEARGVFCKRIKVDYASHSPQVDALRDELVAALADVGSGAPAVPMRSTVTGAWVRDGELTAAYWADNLRQPVRFAEAVDDLLDEDHAIFVELSPHPVLVPAIEELRSERGAAGAVTGSLQRDHGERASLLAALGKLHVAGQAIRWPEVLGPGHRVALPSYPWQHAHPSAPPPAPRTRAARGPEVAGEAEVAGWFHAIEWRARRVRRTEQLPPGRWGLLGDDAGVASALGDALSRAGAAVVVAPRADGVEALLARGELTHVILAPGDERDALAGLRAIARSAPSAPRCWLVTRGAVATGPDDPPAHPDHAAIWGLGRSFALEHPRAWGGLVDLPGDARGGIAGELADRAAAWLFESSEDQIAVRAEATRVPRLVPRAPRGEAPAWTTAGTVLVTGGLGGLGVALAHWLVRRGVRQLLLTSRRGLEAPGAHEVVEQLTALGAEVRVAHADAADREAMAAAVAGLAAPVTAVFHAAGVTDGTPIAELSDARLAEVLSPKRDGARVLAELAKDWALDAFVCFSSCSGVWGHGGQAAYAAANACLDAWAPAARARGIPALAVSWGRWGGAGMGNHEHVHAHLARRGFRAMAPERALSALEQVLASGEAHAVIADIDWTMFRKGFEAWRPSPLLAELEGGRDDRRAEPEPAGRQPAWRDQLLALSPAQRRAAILDVVRAEVARVLAMPGPQAVAPGRALRELGLDSLMAVELQNALGRRLATALPTTLAFDHPTPDALADHLAARIADHDPGDDAGAWQVEPGRRERAADAWLGSLSHGQERLWFLDRLAPRSALYNELWGVQLTAELDLALLRRCLAALVCRHEALRTTFPEIAIPPERAEGPRALIAPDGPLDLAAVDLRGDDERRATLTRLATELRDRPFELARGPLWRVMVATLADDHHVVLFAQHHIITDGTSRRILADELAELYRSGGDPDVLPASPFDFSDFVRDERRRAASAEHQRRIAWWRQPLDALARLELPYARTGRAPGHAGDAVDVSVSPAVRRAVRELAVREGFTVFEILLTAWACVLQRYTGQSDFAIGTIAANRGRTELDRMVGFFVNTLVVRCDLPARVTFRDLVRRLGATVRDAIAHDVDFGQVVEAHAGDRGRERNPILQTTLNLLPPPSDLGSGWAWADPELLPRSRTAKFDLALEFLDVAGGLHGRLEYATDSFDRAMIEQIARHFEVLLAAGVADASAAIEQLPVLTDEERRDMIVTWNDTALERPDVCIHALIERQAARTPDAVALVDEQQQLSYAELELRANQLAHHLIAAAAARGAALGPGLIVGLCLERSVELIVALLAVLKTGAAYLPLDPAYPPERLAFLLGDSRAALLVSDSAQRGRLHGQAAPVVEIDVERDAIRRCATTRPDAAATPDDLVYVIYTSGSTGKPKGVEIGHRGLVNLIEHMAGELAVVPGDEMLAITSLSFDLSVPDVYLPLTRGATCRLVSRSQAGDGFLLRQAVERATIMQATPSTWHMLIEAGWAGSPRLRAVCGGEAYSWQLAVQLAERTRRVWNCYGPTEATVWSTMWAIDPRRGSVSLGRGIANTRLYVLDANLEPVPVGVPGELFIAGAGLARGYLDRPELTRERFVADRFADRPEQRMYRTGDRVQWSHDGTLAFLDRRDLQVKVRGFRIELGEVETALDGHPAVLRSAVVAKSSGLDARLVGYYVVRDGAAVDPGELHQHLKASLPAQMIPSALVALPALPLTPNGKVDRRALATLEAPRAQGPALQPRDDLERALVETWKSVLDLPEIDVGRTFFEQGGTSLLLVRVQRRLHADLGLKVSVAELFAYPSIEALADHLRQAGPSAPPRRAEPGAVPVPAPGVGADAGTAPPQDPPPELEDLSMAELERAVKDRLLDFLDERP
jgi:amino acid adenylation domain-containing protein